MKKKSGWRKNPNMQDVEDFLEEQRLIERIGGYYSIYCTINNALIKN